MSITKPSVRGRAYPSPGSAERLCERVLGVGQKDKERSAPTGNTGRQLCSRHFVISARDGRTKVPQRLFDDRSDVGQLFVVVDRRRTTRANDGVNLGLGFALDVGMGDHGKEEADHRAGGLSQMSPSLAKSEQTHGVRSAFEHDAKKEAVRVVRDGVRGKRGDARHLMIGEIELCLRLDDFIGKTGNTSTARETLFAVFDQTAVQTIHKLCANISVGTASERCERTLLSTRAPVSSQPDIRVRAEEWVGCRQAERRRARGSRCVMMSSP